MTFSSGLPRSHETLLPLEVMSMILRQCDTSSMFNFALVHSAFTSLAEENIYRSINLDTDNKNTHARTTRCLETLQVCVRKATYVRSLKVKHSALVVPETEDFASQWDDIGRKLKDEITPQLLTRALKNMVDLEDLRISQIEDELTWGCVEWSRWGTVRDAIKSQVFRLRNLYCPLGFLDSEIITNQPSLQAIGVYHEANDFEVNERQMNIKSMMKLIDTSRRETQHPPPLVVEYSRNEYRVTFHSSYSNHADKNMYPENRVSKSIELFSKEWSPNLQNCTLELWETTDMADFTRYVDALWENYSYVRRLSFDFLGNSGAKIPINILLDPVFKLRSLECVKFEDKNPRTPRTLSKEELNLLHCSSGLWKNPDISLQSVCLNGEYYPKYEGGSNQDLDLVDAVKQENA